MFERFTKEARAAVVGAQLVARETGTSRIDTRHVLVAFAGETGPASRALSAAGVDTRALARSVVTDLRSGGLDADALARIGIDLDAVRARTDEVFGPGALDAAAKNAPRGHIPFTPDAKKALELALREAIRLKQRHIDSGHLLLGILRAECPGRAALVTAGADLDAIRRAVETRRAA